MSVLMIAVCRCVARRFTAKLSWAFMIVVVVATIRLFCAARSGRSLSLFLRVDAMTVCSRLLLRARASIVLIVVCILLVGLELKVRAIVASM